MPLLLPDDFEAVSDKYVSVRKNDADNLSKNSRVLSFYSINLKGNFVE